MEYISEKPSLVAGLYRHYKGGMYRLLVLGRHTETLEWIVVYASETEPEKIWVRPYEMFIETVIVDGMTKPRFERIENE